MLQIEIENLSKNYHNKKVLKNISLKISSDKYNFIVGANGSGKSTFVKCLNGIIEYDGYINKKEYEIAYSPEKVNLPDYITMKNFLILLSRMNYKSFYEISKKIEYYLNIFNLKEYDKVPIIKLSQGTKQKIILIQALLKEADVYVFDEPLNGIDESSKEVFISELSKLKKLGKLILIITHQIKKYPFTDINIIDLND